MSPSKVVKGRVDNGKLFIKMYDQRTDNEVEVEYKGVWGNLDYAGLSREKGRLEAVVDRQNEKKKMIIWQTNLG